MAPFAGVLFKARRAQAAEQSERIGTDADMGDAGEPPDRPANRPRLALDKADAGAHHIDDLARMAGRTLAAIVDDGGHLLWLQRLDGAAPVSAHIAPAKAHTAALGRRESKVYEDVINNGRFSFLSAPYLQGMLEGGVPIIQDGQCIGAIGVSGVKSNEDAQIAKAGIAALGL